MFVASYRNTERGFADRTAEKRCELHLLEKRQKELDAAEAHTKALRELEAEAERIEARLQAFEHSRRLLAEMGVDLRRFRHTYKRIERKARTVFRLSAKELRGNRRDNHVVLARQFVMYWCCRLTNLSLPQIGRLMGGRDHTTVLHGKRKYVAKRAAMGRTLRPVR